MAASLESLTDVMRPSTIEESIQGRSYLFEITLDPGVAIACSDATVTAGATGATLSSSGIPGPTVCAGVNLTAGEVTLNFQPGEAGQAQHLQQLQNLLHGLHNQNHVTLSVPVNPNPPPNLILNGGTFNYDRTIWGGDVPREPNTSSKPS